MFLCLIFFITFFYLNSFSQDIITIEIDGSNLPDDKGTVSEGKKIYLESCSNCHGYSGEGLYGPELVGRSSLNEKNTSKTIGNFWPYAPKIFDYIKRAKRNDTEKFFSDSDVYSLTGFLLKLNDLYDEEIIDKEKLSDIKMPNRDGFIRN
jgi:Cytochrome c, mono- and diheme variants